jgi:hypothetical protein
MKNLEETDEQYNVVFSNVKELHGNIELQVSGTMQSRLSLARKN